MAIPENTANIDPASVHPLSSSLLLKKGRIAGNKTIIEIPTINILGLKRMKEIRLFCPSTFVNPSALNGSVKTEYPPV